MPPGCLPVTRGSVGPSWLRLRMDVRGLKPSPCRNNISFQNSISFPMLSSGYLQGLPCDTEEGGWYGYLSSCSCLGSEDQVSLSALWVASPKATDTYGLVGKKENISFPRSFCSMNQVFLLAELRAAGW